MDDNMRAKYQCIEGGYLSHDATARSVHEVVARELSAVVEGVRAAACVQWLPAPALLVAQRVRRPGRLQLRK